MKWLFNVIKNNGEWVEGFTWTTTRLEITYNPDGSSGVIRMQGGVFFYITFLLFNRLFKFYAGCKPTPPWSIGYGNEGIFNIGRLFKKIGIGNVGVCLIRLKIKI